MVKKRKKAIIVGIDNGALLIGGLTLLGLGTIMLVGKGKKEEVQAMAATQTISQEGVEDILFATVLDNADRPDTVLRNQDRVRESIQTLKPKLAELVKQYTDGRLDYDELKQEIKALSLLVHEQLSIPIGTGISIEKKFHPDKEDYPAKYGHRNKQWKSKMINHGGVPRGKGPDCDCLPDTYRMMKKERRKFEIANAYPGKALGLSKKDDGFEPPGFNKGWELGRGNPHDDNTIPIVPNPPFGKATGQSRAEWIAKHAGEPPYGNGQPSDIVARRAWRGTGQPVWANAVKARGIGPGFKKRAIAGKIKPERIARICARCAQNPAHKLACRRCSYLRSL